MGAILRIVKLRFPESEIKLWAEKYIGSPAETQLINLKLSVQQAGHITKQQLRVVAKWKSNRSAGYMERNEESYVKEITSWAFSTTEERSRIEVLTLLDGVLWPSASAILHLYHKDRFPVLDFRALWSVNENEPKQYSFPFWWEYVEFCRDVARRNSVDMRTLDRALWQYSEENDRKEQATKAN